MSVTTTSLTEATRKQLAGHDLSKGLPPLPFPLVNEDEELTAEQQEANLLHVALWILERAGDSFNMAYYKASKYKVEDVARNRGLLKEITSLVELSSGRGSSSTLLSEDRQFAYVNEYEVGRLPKEVHPCGTTFCIGGFACEMNGGSLISEEYDELAPILARELLGKEAGSNFYLNNEDAKEFLEEVIARNS